jgi:predicted  nucleic acid-binding Zn-ribbon protein
MSEKYTSNYGPPFTCTKCGHIFHGFREDMYAGHDIIQCPKCRCDKIKDTNGFACTIDCSRPGVGWTGYGGGIP